MPNYKLEQLNDGELEKLKEILELEKLNEMQWVRKTQQNAMS